MAILPEEAEAATKVIKAAQSTYLHVPRIWKTKLTGMGSIHPNSGTCRFGLTHKGSGVEVFVVNEDMRYAKKASGKTIRKYQGYRSGVYGWTVRRGKANCYVYTTNIPLTIWKSAHGQGYYRISEKDAKELLKITIGGKIKYASLITWSEAKARKQGGKAVKSWVGKKIVKKIQIK